MKYYLLDYLTSSPSLQIFKSFVRLLLQGKVLSFEDTVDVLTMKDNDSKVEDYVTAIHLLSRDEVRQRWHLALIVS
jgi:hypothetical protein